MTPRLASILVVLAACGGGTPATKPTPATPVTPVASAEPTTAEQIMEASIAAQGGRPALSKLTSVRITGTLAVAGIKGKIVTLTTPPQNSLTTIDLPGLGQIVAGVHDGLAWEKSAMTGARVLKGPELATTLRDATFNADLVWKDLYPKVQLLGDADFAGQKTWKLQMTSTDGEQQTRYVAKDTKYVIGTEMIATTQMGKLPISVTVSDFRDVQGLKFPFSIKRNESSQALDFAIENVELNVPIDPKTFDIPDDIKQLAAKK